MIKMTMLALTVATAGIMAADRVQAGQCSVIINEDKANMEDSQTGELLQDGKFAQVDERLEKKHRKNLSSDRGDFQTMIDIDHLIKISGQTENLLKMWVDQRPQSFFAQYSAGSFYFDESSHIFGGRPMSEASPSQLERAKGLREKAVAYLQKAMQLDPRSALPHAIMLDIAAYQGQAAGKNSEQWLQAANQVDPKNLAARMQALGFLSPRWGGSFELLDQIAEQAKKSLSTQGSRYLDYRVVMAKASHEEVIAQNKSKANELYKRAKEMCENSEAAQEGIVRTYQ
ncbi:MAG: DUF4034 domain-containing protein [Burkholderiaceae bacterium]|jgi:tetratricopeptide (TPR) repeat protein|nr:DUF4034 domain-containing protein [Burkholderiaceae bacterium]